MNRALVTALITIGSAQLLKIPIKRIKKGKWDVSTLLETGGMPSSHSAGVTSLATYVALKRGIPTIDFALATIFGLIVMYDAQGIRRQAGELTIKVNELDQQLEKLEGEHPGLYHQKRDDRLREKLGHQPEEVVGGAILGILTGSIGYLITD